jgi:hypothetical protein
MGYMWRAYVECIGVGVKCAATAQHVLAFCNPLFLGACGGGRQQGGDRTKYASGAGQALPATPSESVLEPNRRQRGRTQGWQLLNSIKYN